MHPTRWFGACASAAGLGPGDAAVIVAHHAVVGPASAAVRLLGLDPLAVASVLAGLATEIDFGASGAAAAGGQRQDGPGCRCCPPTAIRDDIGANLEAVEDLEERLGPLDLVLVETEETTSPPPSAGAWSITRRLNWATSESEPGGLVCVASVVAGGSCAGFPSRPSPRPDATIGPPPASDWPPVPDWCGATSWCVH